MRKFFIKVTEKDFGIVEERLIGAKSVVEAIGKAVKKLKGFIKPEDYYKVEATECSSDFGWVVKGKLCDGYFHRVFSSEESALYWLSKWVGYKVHGGERCVEGEYGTLYLSHSQFDICPKCGNTMDVGGFYQVGLCLDCLIDKMLEEEDGEE